MTAQTTQPTQSTRVPSELESPCAKLVYLYLATHDGATVSELHEGLDLKKLTLFSVLRSLRKRGLVGEETDRYVVA